MNSLSLADCRITQRLLARSQRPMILLGARAVETGAVPALTSIALRFGAALFTTPDALSAVRTTEVHAGVCSFGATSRSQAIASASDFVLVVGTSGGEFAGRGGKCFPNATIAHLVDDPADLGAMRMPEVTMIGDLRAIAEALVAPEVVPRARWYDHIVVPTEITTSAPGPGMNPREGMAAIATATPSHVRLALDTTTAALVALHDAPFSSSRIWLNVERSACMGTALATSLGIRLASGLSSVAILGDWGALMCLSDLHTAARLGLSGFVVIVWSNGGGSMVRMGAKKQSYRVPESLHTWSSPDFAAIAQGMGIAGVTAESPSELHREVAKAIGAPHPVLINAIIHPDAEIPGAGARFDVLDQSRGSR